MEYIIKGIDRDFWNRVKATSASEGKSIKQVILSCLKVYLQDHEGRGRYGTNRNK